MSSADKRTTLFPMPLYISSEAKSSHILLLRMWRIFPFPDFFPPILLPYKAIRQWFWLVTWPRHSRKSKLDRLTRDTRSLFTIIHTLFYICTKLWRFGLRKCWYYLLCAIVTLHTIGGLTFNISSRLWHRWVGWVLCIVTTNNQNMNYM